MRSSEGGYGFRQAMGKESDPAYTAAMGVLKACHGVAQVRKASSLPRLAFAFPVIVIDSPDSENDAVSVGAVAFN